MTADAANDPKERMPEPRRLRDLIAGGENWLTARIIQLRQGAGLHAVHLDARTGVARFHSWPVGPVDRGARRGSAVRSGGGGSRLFPRFDCALRHRGRQASPLARRHARPVPRPDEELPPNLCRARHRPRLARRGSTGKSRHRRQLLRPHGSRLLRRMVGAARRRAVRAAAAAKPAHHQREEQVPDDLREPQGSGHPDR